MLFYEWRSGKGGNEQRNQSESPTSMSPGSSPGLQDTGKSDEAQASTSDHVMVEEKPAETNAETSMDVSAECDIDIENNQASTSSQADEPRKALTKAKRKSLLNKDLEDWIWQDNRHYLEDRNIFEHTYFK